MLHNTYLDMNMSIKQNHAIDMSVNIALQQTCSLTNNMPFISKSLRGIAALLRFWMLHSLLCEPQIHSLSWLKHPESMVPPRHPRRAHCHQHLHLSRNQWLLWNGGGSMFSMPVRFHACFWPLPATPTRLWAAASFTLRCMFTMICALTFCMSPYMSGVDHTCATIPCALGKVYWRQVGLEMSSLPELSFSLSRESCLSTCATHCFRDVLRTGNVSCRHCSTGTPSSWFAKIVLYVMLGLWTLLYHVTSLPHATIIAGIGSLTASRHGVSCKRAVLSLRISWSTRCGNTQHKASQKYMPKSIVYHSYEI